MSVLMAERRAADEAGRQESLFEALEPAPAPNPWAPPHDAPAPHDEPREAHDEIVSPVDGPDVDVAPHDEPREADAIDDAAAPSDAPDVDVGRHDAGEGLSPPAHKMRHDAVEAHAARTPRTIETPAARAVEAPAARAVEAPAAHAVEAPAERAVETPAAADAEARAPVRAAAPLAGPTLDDVMSRVWEGLVIGLPAACPVCHGEVVPSLGGPLLGRCASCGTAID